jgi:hypothetical protein
MLSGFEKYAASYLAAALVVRSSIPEKNCGIFQSGEQ